METFTFITGNASKAQYLSDYFHVDVAHRKLDLPEIQSLDLEEIVIDKAKRAYEIMRSPVLVEDVSLTFLELDALPGPLIKWFLETLGNERLCFLIGEDRRGIAEVKFAIYNGNEVKVFGGKVTGTITKYPQGDTNFGWDPIFIPNGYSKTWAEMTSDEKHETSMRKIALEKLGKYLEKNF